MVTVDNLEMSEKYVRQSLSLLIAQFVMLFWWLVSQGTRKHENSSIPILVWIFTYFFPHTTSNWLLLDVYSLCHSITNTCQSTYPKLQFLRQSSTQIIWQHDITSTSPTYLETIFIIISSFSSLLLWSLLLLLYYSHLYLVVSLCYWWGKTTSYWQS